MKSGTPKEWYIAGLVAMSLFAATCCAFDALYHELLDVEGLLTVGLPLGILISGLIMLIAGTKWSRVGNRSHVIWCGLLGLVLPFFVGWVSSVFGARPNIHGLGVSGLMLDGLLSVITLIAMLIGMALSNRSHRKTTQD